MKTEFSKLHNFVIFVIFLPPLLQNTKGGANHSDILSRGNVKRGILEGILKGNVKKEILKEQYERDILKENMEGNMEFSLEYLGEY